MPTTAPTAIPPARPIITCGECGTKLGTAATGDPDFGKRLFLAHRALGQCEALR